MPRGYYTAYMPPNNGGGPFTYMAIAIAVTVYHHIVNNKPTR